jgi:hypothetical protein
MTDVPPEPPAIPTAEQLAAAALIDQAALQHWGTIAESQMVVLYASRADLDHLLLGLRLLAFCQGDTLEALNLLSAGDTPAAAVSFQRATNNNVQALAHITQFTSAIMARAQVDG